MTDFKAGDRVVYVGNDWRYSEPEYNGLTGTVRHDSDGDTSVSVSWDDSDPRCRTASLSAYPGNIERIVEEKTPLDALRDAVVRAREDGYEVDITVKEAVLTVKEHSL